MSRKNEIVANEVSERKALWAFVRRAEPIQQVRRLMRQKDVLNKDMAERLGVTEAAISRLLKGNQNIQIDTLYMLADALEEPLKIHLGDTESECTYFYEDGNKATVFEFGGADEEMSSTVVQLDHFRKYKTPAYNSFELQCA